MHEEVAVVPLSGYRFLPTDLELVRDYLCKKITNQKLPSDVPVVEYDIYSTEPWNLPDDDDDAVNNKIDTINSNRSYYFVKLLDGIDRHQRIVNPSNSDDHKGTRRGGGGGHWKKTAGGRDTRYVRDETYRSIGVKKSFAFHAYQSCPAPRLTNNNNINTSEEDDGTTTATTTTAMTWKTNWIMDEYRLNSQRTQPWVLCILRKKGGGGVEVDDDDDDEVELLSKLKVQQQPPNIINHDDDEVELETMKRIKTTQERIKTNQIKIWDDQQQLRRLNGIRITCRAIKQYKHSCACLEGVEQIRDEYRKDKIAIEEFQELKNQLIEEFHRKKAELDAERAVIRARTYYQVQLPSRFKKRRKN